jgi:tetratricopeptide (TPR) repeat protein
MKIVIEKFRFSATVGCLALGLWLASSNLDRMAAQTLSLACPLKYAQGLPESSNTPPLKADFSINESKSFITPPPISPACPFPRIPISEAPFSALSGITFGPGEATVGTTFERGDGSDGDLGMTVSNLVTEGKLDEALQVAQKIKDVSQKNEALRRIASAYQEAGQLDRAFEVAKSITDLPKSDDASSDDNISLRDNALSEIAQAYVKAGKLDNALQVAEIMGEGFQAFTLLDIAQKYGEAGQRDRAAEVTDRAVAAYRRAEKSDSTNPVFAAYMKLLALARFAGQYTAIDRNERAAELSSEIFEVAKTLPDQNYMTLSVLSTTVEVYASAGQRDKAAEVLSYSLQAAKNIKETFAKAIVFAQIANGYALLKQPDRAIELLSQALELAKLEKEVSGKNAALVALARTYGVLGQYDKALQVTNAVEPASLRDQVKQTLTCSQKQPTSRQPSSHLQ